MKEIILYLGNFWTVYIIACSIIGIALVNSAIMDDYFEIKTDTPFQRMLAPFKIILLPLLLGPIVGQFSPLIFLYAYIKWIVKGK